MKVQDLNKEYDKLQLKYGAKELDAIYNGGCEDEPDICFVFMNPTGKNIAASKEWKGRKSPWIATKNIWKIFGEIGLLDKNILQKIINKKAKEWTYEFADEVYDNVKKCRYYVTNLGKCTQLDARPLPDTTYKQYLELLLKEIDIIKPKKIITFGNQVSSLFLSQTINVSKCRKQYFIKEIFNKEYKVYPVYYPVGNGMRNIDYVIEDLKEIIK